MDTDSCKEIIPAIYDDIRRYDDELFCVLENDIWYFWEKGLLYLIGEYGSIGFINEEFIGVENREDKISYYKEANELDFVYTIAEKRIIPRSEAYFFYEDLAIICVNGKYGFINRSLELVVPAIYNYVENFENGYAYAEIGDKNYYVDTQGQQVISGVFNYKAPEHYFYDGLAVVCIDGKYGFINRSLELVIPAIYDFVENFENGYAYAEIDAKSYHLDTQGNQVKSDVEYNGSGCNAPDDSDEDEYDGDYIFMEGIHNGLACYKKNGLIGLKGLNNRIVIPPIFDFVYLAYNNNSKCIRVVKNGKYGVIDKDGNVVIECEYDYLSIPSETEDLIIACNYVEEGQWKRYEYGIININKKPIIPPIYSEIRFINNTMAIVAVENEDEYKYGVLDFHLQEFIIPLICDECSFYRDLFFVEKNGKWGYLDLQGNEVMKVEQDFDYSIYNQYFRYYPAEEKERSWERILARSSIDFSKCSLERNIHFVDWEPILQDEYPSIVDCEECPF